MAGEFFTVNMADVDRRFPIAIAECTGECVGRMREKMDRAYEISQEIVHVDTGKLKASGRVHDDLHDPLEPKIQLIYGGDAYDVDYAGYVEFEYPYIEPAIDQVRSL